MSETPYTETEVLLAIMDAHIARAESLLAGFLPSELEKFGRQVQLVSDLILARAAPSEGCDPVSADREHPMPGQVLMRVSDMGDYSHERREQVIDPADANVVTSLVDPGLPFPEGEHLHKPVLDIDLPVTVLASSTPGHHHLLIDKAMTWSQYKQLLRALADTGLVEWGYVRASIEREHTAVRVPWVGKETAPLPEYVPA